MQDIGCDAPHANHGKVEKHLKVAKLVQARCLTATARTVPRRCSSLTTLAHSKDIRLRLMLMLMLRLRLMLMLTISGSADLGNLA